MSQRTLQLALSFVLHKVGEVVEQLLLCQVLWSDMDSSHLLGEHTEQLDYLSGHSFSKSENKEIDSSYERFLFYAS